MKAGVRLLGEESSGGAGAPRRTQQLVTSVVALYGRSRPLTVAILLLLLTEIGIDEPAARTALSRLKKRGVLVSRREGTSTIYELNPALTEVFREGDQRIFSPLRAGPSDAWVLAAFSVPEAQRQLRYRIRKLLTGHGFGTVTPALWIAPRLMYEPVWQELRREGLDPFVELFIAHSPVQQDLADKVARWWDLDELAVRHQAFCQEYNPALQRWLDTRADERACGDALSDYVTVVTNWRRISYVDPGLPVEYLPAGWPGLASEDTFLEFHRALAEPVARFATALIEGRHTRTLTNFDER